MNFVLIIVLLIVLMAASLVIGLAFNIVFWIAIAWGIILLIGAIIRWSKKK